MRPTALISLCLLSVLAGCTAERPPRSQPLPPPSGIVEATAPTGGEHNAAVARWRDFPADRTPRPLVVPYDATAFSTLFVASTARQAAAAGRFVLAVTPPDTPATFTVTLPGGTAEPRNCRP